MAKKDQTNDPDSGAPAKGSKKKLILIAAGALLLLGGGGGAAYFMMASEEPEEAVAEEQPAEKVPAIYHPFEPAFVVNLEGRPSLMQVGIQVRLRDAELEEFLKKNDPMIRHHILNVLSVQDGHQLRSRDAKEKLQSELLAEIGKVVKDNEGPAEVESLFFTSFVLQ